MSRRPVFILFFLFVFLLAYIYPEKFLNLSDVRPPFFILKIPSSGSGVENSKIVYSKDGEQIATYSLLGITGSEFLCRCNNVAAEIDAGCYVKLKKPVQKKKVRKESKTVPETFKLRGITFRKSESGNYFTRNPVPLSIIPELSFQGIKVFMDKVGREFGGKCRVGLLSPEEIEKSIFIKGETTLLSGRNGSPVLLFRSGSKLRENPVSEKILEKLKYEVFVPLKLDIL